MPYKRWGLDELLYHLKRASKIVNLDVQGFQYGPKLVRDGKIGADIMRRLQIVLWSSKSDEEFVVIVRFVNVIFRL